MTNWATISSLATAGGTLVLAVATFSAIRSANRAARTAERSLLAGLRPVLVPSRPEDPGERIYFADGFTVELAGGQASAHVDGDVAYLTVALRNVGPGIGVLHGWTVATEVPPGDEAHAEPPGFRRLSRHLYVPAGALGFWQGAIRDAGDPDLAAVRRAVTEGRPITVDLLYGNVEGGQRTITRIRLFRPEDVAAGLWSPSVSRHWRLDGDVPT